MYERRRYFLTICHLKVRSKKENIVCFSERLGRDAKRRPSNGTHTKELSMKKSEVTTCKSPCRAVTKVCFTTTVNHLYLTSLHSCSGGHTQERCHSLEAGGAIRKIYHSGVGACEGEGEGVAGWRGQGKVALSPLNLLFSALKKYEEANRGLYL